MILREASIEDLGRLGELATEFYAASDFLRNFNLERFCCCWRSFLETDIGKIFLLVDREGAIVGTLGGIVFADLYNGERIATEFFWFVREGARGKGLKLYKAFERWARERHCKQIRMVHLMDLTPDKLNVVYTRLGFEPAELHYVKEMQP